MNNKTFWIWNSPIGEKTIHYKVFGDSSKHIILIHGFGSHTCTWYDLLDPLVKAGYKVWAIDLLGFGYSDKPLDIHYNLELYLDQIKAFMHEMRISKADMIAHSMGGTVALGMAIYHPEQVNSLTLISAMAYPFTLPLGFRIAKRFPTIIKFFCGLAFVRESRKQLVKNVAVSCTPQKVNEAAEPYFLKNGPDAAFTILQRFDNQLLIEMSQKYNQIKADTLIIWGKEDPLIPCKHSEFFKRDMPHSEIFLLSDCGHIPHEEFPKEAEAAIVNFLKK